MKLKAGDIMEEHLMGAGGFGDPFDRDIESVKQDVRNEVASLEGARRDYGVVIDPVTLEVDRETTAIVREARRK